MSNEAADAFMAVARIHRTEYVLNSARASSLTPESFAELGGDIMALISGIDADKDTHIGRMQEQIIAQRLGLGDPVLERDLARHGIVEKK